MRLHFRSTTSTNDRARDIASRGAPHLAVVTAHEQTAGRGRQGRAWLAAPGDALLASFVLRDYDDLVPLRAGLAVADLAGEGARVKWPNDVLLDGRKLAGILVEGRPQEGWVVLGIGINVRRAPAGLPAAALGREDPEGVLDELRRALPPRLGEPRAATVEALRGRDALRDRPVTWAEGSGFGAGIDDEGCLRVRTADGREISLRSGEVHLGTSA